MSGGDQKWITELTAGDPLEWAAQRILGLRLEVVVGAMRHSFDQPEAVHQLRVATRRAGAAVELLADAVPKKWARLCRKTLRRLRRAAGAARDADVFADRLDRWAADQSHHVGPGVDFLHGTLAAERAEARDQLYEAVAKHGPDLEALLVSVPGAVRSPRRGPNRFGELAEQDLHAGLADLAAASDHAADDSDDYSRLHAVRIVGKRLRYAMELFAGCLQPPLREGLYPAVEELQEILGAANDSHVALQRLAQVQAWCTLQPESRSARWLPAFEGLAAHHVAELPRRRREFEAWLERWQLLLADGLPRAQAVGVGSRR